MQGAVQGFDAPDALQERFDITRLLEQPAMQQRGVRGAHHTLDPEQALLMELIGAGRDRWCKEGFALAAALTFVIGPERA